MKKRFICAVLAGVLLISLPFSTAAYAGPRFNLMENTSGLSDSASVMANNVTHPIPPYYYTAPSVVNTTEPEPDSETQTAIEKAVTVFKWQPNMITDRKISKREEGLDMKGVAPELTEAFGPAYLVLNEQIEKAISAKIAAAKESKSRSITFEYEVYDTDSLVSVVILSTVVSASSKKEVTTVNFDPNTGRVVPLTEAVGVNVKPLAEKLLSERIRRNPEKYNTAFDDALPDDQAYYLDDKSIVLLFNEFALASGADEGITMLEMDLSRIISVTINKLDYHVKSGFSLKMIPLRSVCEGIGYEVIWNPEEDRVEIYRDKVLVLDLAPGENNYLVRDKRDKKVRSLESAPEHENGSVYVPISFFDQILSLVTYSIDNRENITFLSYIESE